MRATTNPRTRPVLPPIFRNASSPFPYSSEARTRGRPRAFPAHSYTEQREYLDVIAPAGLVAEGFKSDSGTRGRGKGLSDDALGSFVPGHTPRLSLEADLGVHEEVCFSTACAVGLPLTGKGAQLQGSGNLKVREAERRLEWYRGQPDPAELGRCLDHSLGLFWVKRTQPCLLAPGKDLLAALVLGGKLGAGREGSGGEDWGVNVFSLANTLSIFHMFTSVHLVVAEILLTIVHRMQSNRPSLVVSLVKKFGSENLGGVMGGEFADGDASFEHLQQGER
ncbi:hypothetical protein JCM24511_02027 [Saitozyma sp. JCM 24511]|nr:hypothetical protein JCM24511_02027 [Saitozyma sp. JCM 24511]